MEYLFAWRDQEMFLPLEKSLRLEYSSPDLEQQGLKHLNKHVVQDLRILGIQLKNLVFSFLFKSNNGRVLSDQHILVFQILRKSNAIFFVAPLESSGWGGKKQAAPLL